MKLQPLSPQQCELVRKWRNQCLETLRTPYALTEVQQARFYGEVVCNPNSPHRYWAIMYEDEFVGMGGLTNIQWENRLAEISLIINPEYRNKGCGKEAVFLLLDWAFNHMNLQTVYGECYRCNPNAVFFWETIIAENQAYSVELPKRKYWQGHYYDSIYFSFNRYAFDKVKSDETC